MFTETNTNQKLKIRKALQEILSTWCKFKYYPALIISSVDVYKKRVF